MRFATRTDLMAHQETAVAKLLPSRVNAIFMDLGTGKSRVLIHLAYLRQEKWDVFVWFCPVAARENTRREVLKHTDLTEDRVLVVADKYDDVTVPRDRVVYIVGIESMQSSTRIVLLVASLVTERSFVAVDESTYIKGIYAQRTDRITRIAKPCLYRAILSGTPLTQGIADLFAQMRFLSPNILGYASYYSFANNHITFRTLPPRRGHKRERVTSQIVSTHNHAYLAAKIAPYAYQVLKSECLDLPPQRRGTHYLALTDAQREAYDKAKEAAAEEAMEQEDPYSMTWILRLYTRLQSITCGFLDAANPQPIRHDRIESLMYLVGEVPSPSQVVVWSKYQYCQRQIADALGEAYGAGSVAQFHGGNAATRDCEVVSWQGGERRFLVATQSSGGHAQTWVAGADVFFYADSFKYSERRQAEDRTHRIGQVMPVDYTTLVGSSSIDERINSAIRVKGNALVSFQQQVEAVRHEGMDRVADLIRSL